MAEHCRSPYSLFFFFIFLLAAPSILYAEDRAKNAIAWVEDDSIDDHQTAITSTDARVYKTALASRCSDGAALYLRRSLDEGESRLFLFKDGRPVHYWREESGWYDWSLFSIACMKHAIILWGEGGTGVRTFVLTTDQGRPIMTYLQGEGLLSVEENENQTTLRLLTRKYDNEASEYTFDEPFVIDERYLETKEERDLPPIGAPPAFVSMKMSCYNGYNLVEAQSRLAENSVPRLFIDLSGREQNLSFLPTNGLCWDNKMILKGLKDGKPAAIIVENKPLRPEFETCGNIGPTMSEIREVAPNQLPPPWDKIGWEGLNSENKTTE